MKKNILISGVNGFIGSHIAHALRSNYNIIGTDTNSICFKNNVDYYYQFILPDENINKIFEQFSIDWCIHCAGSASVLFSIENPVTDYNSGPNVVINLLEAIRNSKNKTKIMFFSSAAVYGNPESLPIRESDRKKPISPYGYHKLISENILEEYRQIYGISSVIFRLFSAYGNDLRKQIVWDACNKLSMPEPVFWGTGNETRDFIHINDICKIIEIFIKKNIEKGIYNIANGLEIKIRDLVNILADNFDIPNEKIIFNGVNKSGNPERWIANIAPITDIGYVPSTDICWGLKQYVEWFKLNKMILQKSREDKWI
ncbi:MAG: NAD-dependent epimerase/dehydratase family protein [Ignavibacteria bacterium]|nr:NAD-dependent epimerase/dehydratase family protein [Ignavibacteria bacterium]MCU7503732.1 NAD-dependent epimerase/dehydratase family protein [Ignavibacteria bacterium]MCU7517622.1 NAD-dependent epimerase/dehydratase family protein [Ignavibacteria bacterium]